MNTYKKKKNSHQDLSNAWQEVVMQAEAGVNLSTRRQKLSETSWQQRADTWAKETLSDKMRVFLKSLTNASTPGSI